jgi:hypothetical protein
MARKDREPEFRSGTIQCRECDHTHPAEFSHINQHNGAFVFEAECNRDWLTDYYTEDVVTPR